MFCMNDLPTLCHSASCVLLVRVNGGGDCHPKLFPHQSLPVRTLRVVGWLSFSLYFSPFCTVCAGVRHHSTVVRCGTAGAVFWGVMWGLLTFHSSKFSVSHGWFLLLPATLPSNAPQCRLQSVLSFLSASTVSVSRSWLCFDW